MNLDQIRYTLEISRTGSINKAAKKLYMSQSNLSSSMKNLEKELNFSIFKRTNKGIKLTPAGQELIRYADAIVEQINFIGDLCNISQSDIPLSFNVSSQHYGLILKEFLMLQQKYIDRNCNFTFREIDRMSVIEDVYSQKYEIGIISISNLQEKLWLRLLKQKQLEFFQISKENLYIYLGPKHPLYNNESIQFNQLKEYPYVAYIGDLGTYHLELKDLGLFNPTKKINVYDRASMQDALLQTNVYSMGLHLNRIYGTDKAYDQIKAFPVDIPGTSLKLGWVKHKQSILSPIGKEFIEVLYKHFEN